MLQQSLESRILSYANGIGLSPAGICQSTPFNYLEQPLQQNNHKLKGFVEKDIKKRIDPNLSYAAAKSIIAVGLPYTEKNNSGNGVKTSLPAYISVSASGTDYHILMKEKLSLLSRYMESIAPACNEIYCDTGPLVERALGQKAGLGFIGKNTSLISPQEGSCFYMGYILTNLSLSPSIASFTRKCGDCNLCVNACPAQALTASGQMIYSRCISYLTQSKKELTPEEMKTMGQQLYGCDICQKVCPYNQQQFSSSTAYKERVWDIPAILEMTKKEFRQTIGQTAAGWQGKKWITRNALVNLTNIQTEEAKTWLIKYRDHENETWQKIAKIGLGEL